MKLSLSPRCPCSYLPISNFPFRLNHFESVTSAFLSLSSALCHSPIHQSVWCMPLAFPRKLFLLHKSNGKLCVLTSIQRCLTLLSFGGPPTYLRAPSASSLCLAFI